MPTLGRVGFYVSKVSNGHPSFLDRRYALGCFGSATGVQLIQLPFEYWERLDLRASRIPMEQCFSQFTRRTSDHLR